MCELGTCNSDCVYLPETSSFSQQAWHCSTVSSSAKTHCRDVSGKGIFSKGSNGEDEWRGDKEWLDGLQAVELAPVDTLMQTCLLHPIQEQVQCPCPLALHWSKSRGSLS